MDTQPRTEAAPVAVPRTPEGVLAELLRTQKVCKLATAGGPVSPWITSVYFAEEGLAAIHFTLEQRGTGMANVAANPKVALAIDAANAFAPFAQAEGEARILTGDRATRRFAALRAKVPEAEPLFQGKLHFIEVRISRWLLTSFPDRWFPAREIRP